MYVAYYVTRKLYLPAVSFLRVLVNVINKIMGF